MIESNLYDILGVGEDATPEEIKLAYRTKAKSCHPDLGGNEQEFIELQKAYEILSDSKLRSDYDKFGIVPTKEQRLINNLNFFFIQTIDKLYEKGENDSNPFEAMIKELNVKQKATRESIGKIEEQITFYCLVLSRLSVKSNAKNTIELAVRESIESAKLTIISLKDDLEVMGNLVNLVTEYSYKVS